MRANRKEMPGFSSQRRPCSSNRATTMTSLSDKARRGAEMIVKSFNAIIIDEETEARHDVSSKILSAGPSLENTTNVRTHECT